MNGHQIKRLLKDNGYNVKSVRRRGVKTLVTLVRHNLVRHCTAHKLLKEAGVRNLTVTGLL